ncbi:MAG: DUF4834 family protein [Prevotella sp.]|nr:DUF4834 family protein [Prevotella sp.]
MIFLNLIFIIILCAIFAFIFTAFGIFRSIYNFKKKFNDLTSGGKGKGKSSGGFDNSSSFGSYGRTGGNNGQVIIDNRNPNQANRKIFSDNEGEYVDFEEE